MQLQANYIWVHNPSRCYEKAIPPKLFASFQKNAFSYGDIPFNLWVEDTDAYQRYLLPPNVTVRIINEENAFPEYEEIKNSCSFEAGVDFLRLLVIRKMLIENPSTIVVYADFDVFDLKLSSDDFMRRLDKYGMALAGAYYPALIKNIRSRFFCFQSIESVPFRQRDSDAVLDGDIFISEETARYRSSLANRPEYREYGRIVFSDFENGFIAMNVQSLPILGKMISRSLSMIREKRLGQDARDPTYFAMAETLDLWAKNATEHIPEDWRSRIARFYVQYCSGWRLDDNAALIPYTRKGVFFKRVPRSLRKSKKAAE